MIEENQVTILLGETGCGKSTRFLRIMTNLTIELPQFLFKKYQATGIIGITQPRRVAAINLARRVAEEHGTQLRNRVSPSTFLLNIGWLFNSI
jgi:ATP-dependent RNA helicase DHR2